MIFATVGSMFPFDRLVRTVDSWCSQRRNQELLVQIGDGEYIPTTAKWVRTLSPNRFYSHVQTCTVLVAHVGMGSLLAGMQARKPMILLPRIRSLGEHTTDHQVHTAKWIKGKRGIWIADDEAHLSELLDQFVAGTLSDFPDDVSLHASSELIENVRRFISNSLNHT